MSTKLNHLEKLFEQQLKDVYSAETQLVDALPKMRDVASDPALKEAFESHLAETREHVERVEQICHQLGVRPQGHPCKAMRGLLDEAGEVIKDKQADDAVRDAALICAAQKVEHYEIATYGCLIAYADLLGKSDIVAVLEHTIGEEGQADKRLTEIAVGWLNEAAASTGN